jgi:hypothetical protein
MIHLEDTDLMPFGKHRGLPMSDVPARYLHWLWTSGKEHEWKTDPVAAYIKQNIDALKKEYSDGIW